ncbi:MAG: hypothetical protein ACERKN_21920 [Velocimicrobium sp.]
MCYDVDMFPRTDKARKMAKKRIDIFPHTDEGVRLTSYPLEPRRDHSCTTSERYVKILDFRHFERHFMFSQGDRKEKKKAISDGVNVSVVLDMVLGNT